MWPDFSALSSTNIGGWAPFGSLAPKPLGTGMGGMPSTNVTGQGGSGAPGIPMLGQGMGNPPMTGQGPIPQLLGRLFNPSQPQQPAGVPFANASMPGIPAPQPNPNVQPFTQPAAPAATPQGPLSFLNNIGKNQTPQQQNQQNLMRNLGWSMFQQPQIQAPPIQMARAPGLLNQPY